MNIFDLTESPKMGRPADFRGIQSADDQSAASPIGSGTSERESKKKPVTMMGVAVNEDVDEGWFGDTPAATGEKWYLKKDGAVLRTVNGEPFTFKSKEDAIAWAKKTYKVSYDQQNILATSNPDKNLHREPRAQMEAGKKIKSNFKMPPESVQDKMYRQHQELRKQRGAPSPEEYKERIAQKQKEIDDLKEGILDRAAPKMPKPRNPANAVLGNKVNAAGKHLDKKRRQELNPKHKHQDPLEEGWKDAVAGAALAGSIALGSMAHAAEPVVGQGQSKDMQMAVDMAKHNARVKYLKIVHGDNFQDKQMPDHRYGKLELKPNDKGGYIATVPLIVDNEVQESTGPLNWTIHFDDGTSQQVTVPSDEFDVRGYFAKRGKKVVKIDYSFAAQDRQDAPRRGTSDPAAGADSLAKAQSAYDRGLTEQAVEEEFRLGKKLGTRRDRFKSLRKRKDGILGEVGVSESQAVKITDYDTWSDEVKALGGEIHTQRDRNLLVAQSWDGEEIGKFHLGKNMGFINKSGDLDETIRKMGSQYRLLSKKGKNLGTFDSKAGAEKHEREVQYFKHKNMEEDTSAIKKKISKYEELALAANRAGDDAKCKMYQKKIQALKSQSLDEGWKGKLAGAVFAGLAALGGAGDADAQQVNLPGPKVSYIATVQAEVNGEVVTRSTNMGSNYKSEADVRQAVADYMESKGIIRYRINIDQKYDQPGLKRGDYATGGPSGNYGVGDYIMRYIDSQIPYPADRNTRGGYATKESIEEDIERHLFLLSRAGYDIIQEEWSDKYKSSINCSNPKGFSQKAHCAGKKKNEGVAEGKPENPSRRGFLKALAVAAVLSSTPVAKLMSDASSKMSIVKHRGKLGKYQGSDIDCTGYKIGKKQFYITVNGEPYTVQTGTGAGFMGQDFKNTDFKSDPYLQKIAPWLDTKDEYILQIADYDIELYDQNNQKIFPAKDQQQTKEMYSNGFIDAIIGYLDVYQTSAIQRMADVPSQPHYPEELPAIDKGSKGVSAIVSKAAGNDPIHIARLASLAKSGYDAITKKPDAQQSAPSFNAPAALPAPSDDNVLRPELNKRKEKSSVKRQGVDEDIERYVEALSRAGYEVTEEKVRLDPKCWTGKKIGNPKTKMKGGVRVNNCVPK
jgi:hypothetical protein